VIRCGLAAAAWDAEVTFGDSVGVWAQTGITVMHALRRGELLLSPSLEVESPMLADSSRMVSSNGDSLRAMPPNHMSEPAPTGCSIQVVEADGRRLE
jgi:hypothetical protein